MLKRNLLPAAALSLILAAGCAPADTIGGTGTGGATTAGSGGRAATGTGGSTTPGTGGTTTAGTGGTTTAGTGGTTTAGTGGTTTAGTGGTTTAGTGGSTTAGTGGAATGTGGRGGSAGSPAGTGGRGTGGTAAGTGGSGTGVMVSATCTAKPWPTATGSVTITGTRTVAAGTPFDGGMATHQGSLNDCSVGGQSSTDAMFEIADGGTIRNVVFGTRVGDGIHCLGTCTIENVWFPYICDDAITMLGGSGKTATIRNSGFKGARDKAIQHNGDGGTVVIDNVYVETAGKLYRSCGEGSGCGSASSVRTVRVNNVTAVGLLQVVGVSTNDKATLTNICAYRTSSLCHAYQPGSDTDAPIGANATGEGPSANCVYTAADTHALVNRVSGAVTTDVLCPGPNSTKTGATATPCISGFNTCVKGCAPGQYGFKQVTCTGGMYADVGAGACVPPADATVAARLASTNNTPTLPTVTGNGSCTTEWAWGKDSSARACVCVMKPGYYQASTTGWFVWDCQTPWW